VPFDQSTITGVNPPVYNGWQVTLSWTTTSPPLTWFQIYVNRVLSWWGQTTIATLALATAGPDRVDVGAVLPGEEQTDFSAMLPSAPATRAQLSWQGGVFEGADLAGFRVYGSPAPGSAIDYKTPLADITANPSGSNTSGFGLGGFGSGGFGAVAGTYTWTSHPLATGAWSFGVVPYDLAGNEGVASTTNLSILAPPNPPAPNADGKRLTYTYDATSHIATLHWLASPP
jgi:hypothetical protein